MNNEHMDVPAPGPEVDVAAAAAIEHSTDGEVDAKADSHAGDCEPGIPHDELVGKLEARIGYVFHDRALLRRALTHRSYANEQADPRPMHNEALEFLGDAVLEFLISVWLLELHPTQTEGTLSKLRAYAVSAANLQTHAARLQLGEFLLLNRGEEKTGGRTKVALLVDSYEALIAAIYLDGGIDSAKRFVRDEFTETFRQVSPDNLTATDYKTALQEKLQALGYTTPRYGVLESLGPDHRRVFQVEVLLNGKRLATGEGTTIKGAHQSAARTALDMLQTQEPETPLAASAETPCPQETGS